MFEQADKPVQESPFILQDFFEMIGNQTLISSEFIQGNYEKASDLFSCLCKLKPSEEDILKALNHSNHQASDVLKKLANIPYSSSDPRTTFMNDIHGALGFRSFFTVIQQKEPDHYMRTEWAEDDRAEAAEKEKTARAAETAKTQNPADENDYINRATTPPQIPTTSSPDQPTPPLPLPMGRHTTLVQGVFENLLAEYHRINS